MLLILNSYSEITATIKRTRGSDQYCFAVNELVSGNINEQISYDADCEYAALVYYSDTKFNNVSVALHVSTASENSSFLGLCVQS